MTRPKRIVNGARSPFPDRRYAPGDAAIPPTMTLPRSDVVQADAVIFCPGPGGWALISSANMRNSG